jgi:hypothetical protein
LNEQLLCIKQTQRELAELLRRTLAVTGPTLHHDGAPQLPVQTLQPPHTHASLFKCELPRLDNRTSSAWTRRNRALSTLAALNTTALRAKRRHAISDVSSHRFTAIKLATLATRAATFKQNSHTVATSQVGQQQRGQKQQQSLKRTLAATIPETSKSFANFGLSDDGTTNEEDKCTSLRTQNWLDVSGQRQSEVFAHVSHRQKAPHTLDATRVISLRYLTASMKTAHIRHAVYVAFVVACTPSIRVARADNAVAGGYETYW